jgi:hypothetical protein
MLVPESRPIIYAIVREDMEYAIEPDLVPLTKAVWDSGPTLDRFTHPQQSALSGG